MADNAAFIRAILAEPKVDLPRLIYADYLDEHNDTERAEFIRIQCKSARCSRCDGDGKAHGSDRPFEGPPGDCPECGTIRRRAETLLNDYHEPLKYATNKTMWFNIASSFDPHERERRFRPEYHRGFAGKVACSLDDWLARGPDIAAYHPIELVTLTDKQPHRSDSVRQLSDHRSYAWFGLWERQLWPRFVIGGELLHRLTQPIRGNSVWYANETDAMADLSVACIRLATEEAKRRQLGAYGESEPRVVHSGMGSDLMALCGLVLGISGHDQVRLSYVDDQVTCAACLRMRILETQKRPS